jgi:hypothetical protein
MEQLALTFDRPAQEHPRLAELIAALTDQGWLKSRQLEALGFTERELREIAETANPAVIFSYPGSPGYKLLADVTLEEFARCYALKHQADAMNARLSRYLRA